MLVGLRNKACWCT